MLGGLSVTTPGAQLMQMLCVTSLAINLQVYCIMCYSSIVLEDIYKGYYTKILPEVHVGYGVPSAY